MVIVNDKKYHAFISYRHADNKELGRQWATWLHQAIETYEVPSDLVGKKNNLGEEIPARIYPIFRDKEELPADADLGKAIVSALDSTRLLIVLCSPRAVSSTYVADEIDYFKKQGHSDHIIATIIDGEPNASWDKGKQVDFSIEDECFPIPLQYQYDNDGNRTAKHAEPIAADFRINNNGTPEQGWASIEAYRQHLKSTTNLDNIQIQKNIDSYQKQQHLMLQKIIAGILGVPLGELTQRDKVYQLEIAKKKAQKLRKWLTVVILLALIAIAAGLFAYFKQQESVIAQIESEQQLVEANHNYGLALFEKAKQEENKFSYYKSNFYAANALLKVKDGKYKSKISSLLTSNINKNNSIWVSAINPSEQGQVTSIDYSPDGKTLASGSFDGTIRLWDIATGKHRAIFVGDNIKVRSLVYSPDGQTLAFCDNDKTIHLWDVATGKQVALLKIDTGDVSKIAFSPNGKFIAASSRDKTIRLWDVTTGKQNTTLKGHDQEVFSVAFSPDGKTLASGSYDLTVRLWDIAAKKQLNSLKGHTEIIWVVVFSPDGKTLASGSFDKTIRIWDIATGKQKMVFEGHKEYITSIEFSPDGKTLASSSADKTIRLWNVSSGESQSLLTGHYKSVIAIKFSLDGRTLASASFDKTIRLWDVEPETFKEFKQDAFAISPDGTNVISALSPISHTTSYLWDSATGKLKALLQNQTDQIYSLSFSPDGRKFATGSKDNIVGVWDLTTGKQLTRFEEYDNHSGIAFSPSNKTIAYGLLDKTISIFNITSGKQLAKFDGHSEGSDMAFSPDGNTLAISFLKSIVLWDIISVKQKMIIDIGNIEAKNICFSPDGKNLAFLSDLNSIRLINLSTHREQPGFEGHEDSVVIIAFSPDGKTLASGSFDKTVRLWDVETGEQLAVFEGHKDLVISIAYSQDGKSLISGSTDKTIRTWNIEQHLNFANNNKYVKQWIDQQLQLYNYQFNGVDLNLMPLEKNAQMTKIHPPNWPKTHPNYWLKKAESGDANAMLQLGIIYHRSSENNKAKNWYTKALVAGHKDAQERLNVLKLTSKFSTIENK